MVLEFNTGRQYSPEGQLIVAVPYDNGVVFLDYTRGIDGYVECPFKKADIMSAYDNNRYSTPVEDKYWRTIQYLQAYVAGLIDMLPQG